MTHTRTRQSLGAACLAVALLVVTAAGCSEQTTPVGPSALGPDAAAQTSEPGGHGQHGTMKTDDKGHIGGWFRGQEVSLYYTKSYFCASPPTSGADTPCVIGAAPEVFPRPGPIPAIYAVAAVGFTPDPDTLACRPGTPCLNHPLMIDASRVAGPGATNIRGLPHSHIVDERGAGWHQTVNIRVFNPGVWDQIVEAKSLAKVRELQKDQDVGGAGLISPDTKTNIFFFIASWQ